MRIERDGKVSPPKPRFVPSPTGPGRVSSWAPNSPGASCKGGTRVAMGRRNKSGDDRSWRIEAEMPRHRSWRSRPDRRVVL